MADDGDGEELGEAHGVMGVSSRPGGGGGGHTGELADTPDEKIRMSARAGEARAEQTVGTGRRRGQSEEKEIGRRSADKRVVRATVSRNSR